MSIPTKPQCLRCRNYSGWMQCLAFPKAIPESIVDGIHNHTRPYPGDNGIRFTPRETAPAPLPAKV